VKDKMHSSYCTALSARVAKVLHGDSDLLKAIIAAGVILWRAKSGLCPGDEHAWRAEFRVCRKRHRDFADHEAWDPEARPPPKDCERAYLYIQPVDCAEPLT